MDRVTKSYVEGERRHVVLRSASARVEAGEFVSLLGPSGSGKSTLLNLVSGIDTADEGTIRVAGVDLLALSERERTLFRRDHIGFVFQFFNLVPTLTVEENLLLPLELQGRLDGRTREHARTLVGRVGLEDRLGSFPDRLSGGERQRIAVARALVHDPALVLADEPTGNLDEDTGEVVMGLLQELLADAEAALLVVTHSRDLAGRADRILYLDHGSLHEERSPHRP